jgi:calcineurin-like phosphoesterase family protein
MADLFTSDSHFFHQAFTAAGHIQTRPQFADEYAMNKILVKNWNEVVAPSDFVYHLGDFAVGVANRISELREVAYSLNGKIGLIRGNHENWAEKHVAERFEWIKDYHEYKVKHRPLICLFHYAMRVWRHSHKGAWHLYGHSHGDMPEYLGSMSMDIGVDSHGFAPVPWDDLQLLMQAKADRVARGENPDTKIWRKPQHNDVEFPWMHHGSSL